MDETRIQPRIYLASGSPYRKMLLARIMEHFDCISPDIDETRFEDESAADYTRRLATEKATQVLSELAAPGNQIIIGSDQCVAVDDQILGKPGNFLVAKQQLLSMAGKTVEFFTSVCVLSTEANSSHVDLDITRVKMRRLSETEIERYLDLEQPFDCAGSFKSEGLGICLFEEIQSSDPTALIGLPLIKLNTLLREAGHDILKANWAT